MRMRRFLWSAGLLAVVSLGAGCAHDETKQARSQGEKVGEAFTKKVQFADQLSLMNEQQIALGHLALRNSNDPEVRRFAEQLIKDHQRNQDDLETLAKAKTMALRTVDLSMEATAVGGAGIEGVQHGMQKGEEKYDKKYDKQVNEFVKKRDKLAGLSGREFDKAFLEEVKKGQEHGKKLVDKGLDEYRDDTTLAMYLGRTAPVIKEHEQRAESLRHSIKD